MTQRELNRELARATGESVRTIAGFGFSLACPDIVDHDPEPTDVDEAELVDVDVEDKIVDWDQVEAGHRLPWIYAEAA